MCGPQQAPRLRGRRGLSTTRTRTLHTHASTHTPQREILHINAAHGAGARITKRPPSPIERERRPPGYEREGRDIIINPYCQPHIRRAARGVCTFCADERTHIVPTVCICYNLCVSCHPCEWDFLGRVLFENISQPVSFSPTSHYHTFTSGG